MGGCLSTDVEHSRQNNKKNVEHEVALVQAKDSEETAVVKEVLSETPKPSSATREQANVIEKAQQAKTSVKADEEEAAYKIYNVKGEEDEGKRRVQFADSPASTRKFQRKCSMSGEFTFSSDQRLSNGSMSSPSCVRRLDLGSTLRRSFSGMEIGGLRRDSGGGSRRRPGSPVAARSNEVSRTSSLRGTGQDSPSCTLPPGYVDYSGVWRAQLEIGEATRGQESLENPLVSLECFIFL